MSKPFEGGVPTEPDVRRLVETIELREGVTVLHEQLEKLLGIARTSSRYKTVIGAWKGRMLRLHNIAIESMPGIGYKVLAAAERVTSSVRQYGRGVRAVGRSVSSIRRVPAEKLTTEQQAVHEHATRHMEATLAQARGDSKAIAFKFTPPAMLPRGPKP